MKIIDLKTAKPGIYYRVFSNTIHKIDFIRYFERIKEEIDCHFGSDDFFYKKVHCGCYEYQQHSNSPHSNIGVRSRECDSREVFFETLEDAKKYVIEHFYEQKIKDYKREIENIETKINEFSSNVVEEKIWLM